MTFLLSFSSNAAHRRVRLRKAGVALLAAMLTAASLTACGVREKRENLKNCEFELDNVEVKTFSFTAVDLIVYVGVMNPNPSDVVVDRLKFDLYTGDNKVANGEQTQNTTIAAGQREVIQLNVSTTASQLGSTLMRALMTGGAVDYRVEGTVFLDTILGEIPYPISLEGNTGEGGASVN